MPPLLLIGTIPVTAALIALILPRVQATRMVVCLLIWLQFVLLATAWGPVAIDNGVVNIAHDLSADHIGILFVLLTTLVAASAFTHAPFFFAREEMEPGYRASRERLYYCASALFLLAMSFVFLCDNLGYLWIAVETTTLCSAPLVYYSATKHALEATWKYFIICSVGIAFALLGTILVFASSQSTGAGGSLNWKELVALGPQLQYPLLRLGFIFCFLGYGTKAGLFPLHSWLPDAHSEAPAPASAMLSGALLNSALFAIFRLSQVVIANNHPQLVFDLAVVGGTATTLAASIFLIRQHGIKRLWAYSSIENVGLMLVAIGFNSPALFFLQALNHSLSKVALFLLSGNIIQALGTKRLSEIRGLLQVSPAWSILLAVAACAVTGSPPFGSFISEWLILAAAADSKNYVVVAALLVSLAISFVAVCFYVTRVISGSPPRNSAAFAVTGTSLVPALLVVVCLIAGVTFVPLYVVGIR